MPSSGSSCRAAPASTPTCGAGPGRRSCSASAGSGLPSTVPLTSPATWARVRERLDQGVTQPPGTGGPDRHTYWLATTIYEVTPTTVFALGTAEPYGATLFRF